MSPLRRQIIIRSSLAALAALTALWLASVAVAAFTQTARTSFTVNRAGQSTGITTVLLASDPAAPGGKPRSVRTLVIDLPAGTRINLATPLVKKHCKLTDRQLTKPFGPACPRASRIGTGTVVANTAPMPTTTKAGVDPYLMKESVAVFVQNAHRLTIVVTPSLDFFAVQVWHATVRGTKLTIVDPKVVYGKLVTSVLASLKLKVPKLGTGSRALIRAGRCTAGRFEIEHHFVYADHGTLDVDSSSACR